jgi:hypothetical protein
MTAVISDRRSEAFDVNVAHETRRYDYWLGGKDNFAADRASGDLLAAAFPPVRIAAVENRRFGRRVTRYLAADCGISQFLDIGTGIPISSNTHEVAQGANPAARVVYVDNDPFVLVHARALLTSAPEGRTAYIEADLRDPARILNAPEVLDTLDLIRTLKILRLTPSTRGWQSAARGRRRPVRGCRVRRSWRRPRTQGAPSATCRRSRRARRP